uniref:DUF2931 family protein n=1 Tax=uncultured Cytophaga sp. TaxID=160238 RepID=UPI002631121D
MKNILFYLMISSLLQFIVSACSPSKRSVHADVRPPLEYASGICAPKLYPVTVHRGDFYTKDDWLPLPNGGVLEAGWGSNGMNMSRSDIIPTGFRVTYFSYVENKFYKGDFALPSETIRDLFKEGMIGYLTKKYATYKAMIVGMAPGGVLVVWMQGVDKQVEIGRYQATEYNMEWESFMSTTGFTKDEFVC